MNSFYATLYTKFADLQVDQMFSARLVYPSPSPLPSIVSSNEISNCIVRIPPVKVDSRISYGPFIFEDIEFGQTSAVKLVLASTCLLSAKSVFVWLYRDNIEKWQTSKEDTLRAKYVINTILDALARKRIRQIEGDEFYTDIMRAADLLASALLPNRPRDMGALVQIVLASYLLERPIFAPSLIAKMGRDFVTRLESLAIDPSKILGILRDSIPDRLKEVGRLESGWDQILRVADSLYQIVADMPGKWHRVYLPYSNVLATGGLDSVFASRLIAEKELKPNGSSDAIWQEIFFEMQREQKRNEKALARLSKAVQNLNFDFVGLPTSDYVSYYKLYTELAPQIRRIIERARMIKNVMDENTFEESGNVDLQVAIQAIASETARPDLFTKDENLLKNESWTILVDSSLSLSGSSREVKVVSMCLAETAREIMGSNPWGMFTFSDHLYCIKDYAEPYGSPVKARLGGITQSGLSHIPDAIRACRKMIAEHACDRNYLILVSDGLPSGYPGIDAEFSISVKELARYGVDLAAISVAGSSIKKTIRRAKVIDSAEDLVKEFMEIYYSLSS